MKNLSNFVLATKNGKTIMCEADDNRLENEAWHVQEGKFIKNKNVLNGKKVLGYFTVDTTNYIVYTNRTVEEMKESV